MKNTKILAVAGAFYFFGSEIDAPEGYIALQDAAMFRRFEGEGLPGVARGSSKSTVTLDCFPAGEVLYFPLSAVYAIMPSIDLYTFKGATVNKG